MIAEFLDEARTREGREWVKPRAYTPVRKRLHAEWNAWLPEKRLQVSQAVTPRRQAVGVDVGAIFQKLAEDWQRETLLMSSATDMILNEHYQRIIGLGPAVVPILLEQLANEPDHWFWALQSILRVDPVPAEARGDIEQMARAWLSWGRANGFI